MNKIDTQNFYEPVPGESIDLSKIDPNLIQPNVPWKF